MFTQTI